MLAHKLAQNRRYTHSLAAISHERFPMKVSFAHSARRALHMLYVHACNNVLIILGFAATILFLSLLKHVHAGEVLALDNSAYVLVVVHMRQAWLTPIMQSISELALPVVLVVMLLAVEAFAPGKRPGACAAVNLALVCVLNLLLKELVHRPRPEGFRLISETGYSFPSGHSMIAMAFYGLLVWMVWRYEKDIFVKYLCTIGFSLCIGAVGLSRIYLGVHYASDVIAGFCVSLAWLAVYTKIIAPLFMLEKELGAAHTPAKHAKTASHEHNA